MQHSTSAFSDVGLAKPIIIFKMTEDCNIDNNERKINLGVGGCTVEGTVGFTKAIVQAYRSNEGLPWVLPVVRSAEAQMAADPLLNHEYLPILGLKDFCEYATELCLGKDSPAIIENRASSVQALGGTGALRLAADFLKAHYNRTQDTTAVYLSDPTWGNHYGIFGNSGFMDIRSYRYWNKDDCCINFGGMVEDLQNAPEFSIVVFHACAHNPTGIDPTREQWTSLAKVCQKKKLFPVFDCAYQGFASGNTDSDAWSIRHFVKEDLEMLVCQSFSKNFGLYNERTGNLIVVLRNSDVISRSRSQLEIIIRRMYSNPPSHGARIVATTLGNTALKQEWLENVAIMATRIKEMRHLLHSKLKAIGTPGNWDHIIRQIGMFSYTGLTECEVEYLVKEKHIYLLSSGRISMCSLTKQNIDYFVQSVYDAVTKSSGRL